MTRPPRRDPLWPRRLLGMAVVLLAAGLVIAAYGELFAWMSDTAWGANP